jgi:hypothetical protein
VTREQLAHVLRAASRIAEVRDVVVIGSQSVLGTFANEVLPEEVIGSIEVDVAFLDDPANEKSDKVDGAIGELSQFHETYQYYAQGVNTSTAVLGPGWEDRLVVFENASTKPGRGLCSSSPLLCCEKNWWTRRQSLKGSRPSRSRPARSSSSPVG